jgi:hypothetical protein
MIPSLLPSSACGGADVVLLLLFIHRSRREPITRSQYPLAYMRHNTLEKPLAPNDWLMGDITSALSGLAGR